MLITLTNIPTKDIKKYPESKAEDNTNCLAKKPKKGGIPAVESKQIVKLKLKIGFE